MKGFRRGRCLRAGAAPAEGWEAADAAERLPREPPGRRQRAATESVAGRRSLERDRGDGGFRADPQGQREGHMMETRCDVVVMNGKAHVDDAARLQGLVVGSMPVSSLRVHWKPSTNHPPTRRGRRRSAAEPLASARESRRRGGRRPSSSPRPDRRPRRCLPGSSACGFDGLPTSASASAFTPTFAGRT